MSKHLLHLGTIEDSEYSQRLIHTCAGQQIAWKQRLTTPDTINEIELQARAAKLDGVVCSNQAFLERLLQVQPDWNPPNNRRGITLDDYQGSLLFTPRDKLPVVIVNPLANLVSQSHAPSAFKRFISKLATPGNWYAATEFTWSLARPETIGACYERMLARASLIGIDIETIIDDPLRRISCIGFSAYYADTHTTETIVIPFDSMFWHSWVQKFCDLPNPKVFQNGLYDNLYLLRWHCPVRNWLHDTLHLFHSMYSEYPKTLAFISAYALRKIRYWKDDGKTGNLEDYYRYNAQDCWATVNSYLSLLRDAEPYAIANYLKEFPLVFPALTCEVEGFAMDMERLASVKAQKEQEANNREADFRRMVAAPGFNLNSPQQVKDLFRILGLSHLPDTAKASMLKAQASSPFNNRILSELESIKKEKKLLSTYFKPEKFWNGRLHYKINPAGTDTGRLASTESSYWCGLQIQNIPRGDSVKQCIVSDPGWLLAEIDKAQSEARCVGYLAGEVKLIEVVEGPNDYHAWNAQAFFGVPYETIYSNEFHKTLNKELRDLSKRTNHGANYNMGAGVMLDTMGPKYVSKAKVMLRLSGSLRQVCQILLDKYATTYPRVKIDWYDSIVREIELTGKLLSPTGRTRVFFGKPGKDKRALNAAVAHQPQSLSVDLINDEWYNLWSCQMYGHFYQSESCVIGEPLVMKQLDLRGLVRLKAQIHDSVVFQYKYGSSYSWIPEKVRDIIMTTRVKVKDPHGIVREMFIPSDISCGKNRWSEIK